VIQITDDLSTDTALIRAANQSLASMAASTTCTHDSITLTAANTQYTKVIPENCKKLTFRVVDSTMLNAGSDLRYAWSTHKVAGANDASATPVLPFMLLDGGSVYFENNLLLTSKTLYVAGITAGDIVLLEMWT
jgi:hypothetical protein